MASNYWDNAFLQHLDIGSIQTVFEVGARYGDESVILSEVFGEANIFSFECNPLTVDICRKKLSCNKNIFFFANALGEREEFLPFYSFIDNNDGASSFLKRIDYEKTQKQTGIVSVRKLSDIMNENNIRRIDLLCMDVQGYELNVLKGAEELLSKIKYVIMEEPNPVINLKFLPENLYTKYNEAPTPYEIKKFMSENNFIEIERQEENYIEHNVMYKNIA